MAGAPGASQALPERLVLRIAGAPSVTTAVATRLAPRLAALGVALDIATAPEIDADRVLDLPADTSQGAPLARTWVNAQDLERAVLVIVPRGGDRVLVRKIPLTLGLDEAGLAELTFIIERSTASLLASQPIGVPHAEARAALGAVKPAPSPSAPAPDDSAQSVIGVGIFGGLASWSSGTSLSPRVGLDCWIDRVSDAARAGLAASIVVDPGFHSSAGAAGGSAGAAGDLLVRAIGLNARITAGRRFGRFGVGRVAVGPGLLVTRATPQVPGDSPSALLVGTTRTDLDPVIGLGARWDMTLGLGLGAFLEATVDIVPLRAKYTQVVDGAERVLFSPGPVRPGLMLGMSVEWPRQGQ